MQIFSCSLHDVLCTQNIPAIAVHELDGSLKQVSCFEFDEGLQEGVVLLCDEGLACLRLDYVVDKIGICKQCHLIRP